MLTFHFVGCALMYSRNSRSNREPCPSRIKNGFSPEFSQSKTCKLSKHFNISVRRWPVMEPLLEWQQKQGMCFPLKKAAQSKRVHLSVTTVVNDIIGLSNPFSKGIYSSPPLILEHFSCKNYRAHNWISTGCSKPHDSEMCILGGRPLLWPTGSRAKVSLTSNLAIFCLRCV
jgi:hypothetical protein